MATRTATDTARTERQRRVEDAVHSGEMEGLAVTAATQGDMDGYVEGRITSDELVARVRARYGLA